MTDFFATILGQAGVTDYQPCYCTGPQNGEPYCPCRMRNEKRVVMNAELDLHTSTPAHIARAHAHFACNLTVLALDLGTTTGFAIAPRNGALRSGSFRLDPAKLGGNGRRWIAFREWLTATAREVGGIQAVYFEDVKNHAGVIAAHVYGGYLAMLEAWCAANNIPLHGVGVGTAKKAWTGAGNADKDAMIAEAKRRGFNPIDDNEADALAILAYGVAQES